MRLSPRELWSHTFALPFAVLSSIQVEGASTLARYILTVDCHKGGIQFAVGIMFDRHELPLASDFAILIEVDSVSLHTVHSDMSSVLASRLDWSHYSKMESKIFQSFENWTVQRTV
jgi:hypothetical protein